MLVDQGCRGTSLIRKSAPLGPHSRKMPRALWWFYMGLLFRVSEVPLDESVSIEMKYLPELTRGLAQVGVAKSVGLAGPSPTVTPTP